MSEIKNWVQISDRLATAGQPTAEQFGDIRDRGYAVVVNLAMLDSTNALANEANLVTGAGMDYVHIPVVWERPTVEDFQRFQATLQAYEQRQQPVFVHCAMNMRVSVFVYLYRVLQGTDPAIARQDVLEVWHPNAIWQGFVEEVLAELGETVAPEAVEFDSF